MPMISKIQKSNHLRYRHRTTIGKQIGKLSRPVISTTTQEFLLSEIGNRLGRLCSPSTRMSNTATIIVRWKIYGIVFDLS